MPLNNVWYPLAVQAINNSSDETQQSTLYEYCRLAGVTTSVLTLVTHLLHSNAVTRVQQIESATQYNDPTELYNTLKHKQQSQYVAVRGVLTTSTPLQSIYAQPVIQLVYQQIKQISTYIKFIPLTRIQSSEYTETHLHIPKAVNTQLHTNSQHAIHIPKHILLNSELCMSTQSQPIAKHTVQPIQTPSDVIHDLQQSRLLKQKQHIESGIENNTKLTVLGTAVLDNDTIELVHNSTKSTIITDQIYEELLNDAQQYCRELYNIQNILLSLSIFSAVVYGCKLGYDIYTSHRNIQRMQQIAIQRSEQIQQNNITQSTSQYEGICVVCTVKQSNCIFMNCQHQCCCSDCSKQLIRRGMTCPVCRAKISQCVVPIIV